VVTAHALGNRGTNVADKARMKLDPTILLLASLGLVCTPDARATSIPILTLTEVSSTELDWSWSTGQHGMLTSAGDVWSGSIDGPDTADGGAVRSSWAELENGLTLNSVTVGSTDPGYGVSVSSDIVGTAANGNGDKVGSTSGAFEVQFFDNAESGSVPDSGSTLLLLTLGLVGIVLLRVGVRTTFLHNAPTPLLWP
jgi:hypothetical protein